MSKAGDIVKLMEEEISEMISFAHEKKNDRNEDGEPQGTASAEGGGQAAHSEEYEMESENLAIPEIHTHKAVDKKHNQDGEDHDGEGERGRDKKPSIHYDGLAVPEIHIPHQK